jgi:hypothetical protein
MVDESERELSEWLAPIRASVESGRVREGKRMKDKAEGN